MQYFVVMVLEMAFFFLVVANNLLLEGHEVVVFHNSLHQMAKWFPYLVFKPFPENKEIPSLLPTFDLVIINKDHLLINRLIRNFSKSYLNSRTWVLCPSTCKGKKIEGDYQLDINQSLVDNLVQFSKVLNCNNPTRDIGISPKKELIFKKFPKRIVIHPTSKSITKNWPSHKFCKLAKKLQNVGFDIWFVVDPREKVKWKWLERKGFFLADINSLDDLASFVYESSYVIGNDSAVGHLASALNIPTFTIFATKRKSIFWKPHWSIGSGVYPWEWVPNIKGLRLRDKLWAKTIFVSKVYKGFSKLRKKVYEKEICSS